MACLTLKRPLEWDSPTRRPTKRRHCDPLDQDLERPSPSKRAMPSRLFSEPSSANNTNSISLAHKEYCFNESEIGSYIGKSEKGLFTFKQVRLICQRMLKERQEEIREEYETILNQRLAEQYDVFVKFTHDQIQKQFEGAPSYLS